MTVRKAGSTTSLPGPSKALGEDRAPRPGRKDKKGIGQTALERWLLSEQATQGGRPRQDPGAEVGKGHFGSKEKSAQEGIQEGE